MMDKRIAWIDNLKAIGILILITVAHTDQYRYVILYERSVLMPIFFFLSGFLFKPEKYATFGRMAGKYAKALLIPYAFFGTLVIVLGYGRDIYLMGFGEFLANFLQTVIYPFKYLLMGNVESLVKIHNGPLWFLPCLFVVKIIYWSLFKLMGNNKLGLGIAVLLVMVLGYLTRYLPIDDFPWSINTAMIVTVFFAAGNLMRPYSGFVSSLRWWMILFVVVIHIYLITVINREAYWAVNRFGNPYLTLVAAFMGILTFIYIADKIKPNKLFSFIGRNTLTIFALHYPMLASIKAIVLPILIDNGYYYTNISFREIPFDIGIHPSLFLIAIIFGLMQLAIVYPIIQVLRRWLPVVIGQGRKI